MQGAGNAVRFWKGSYKKVLTFLEPLYLTRSQKAQKK